LPFCGFPVYLFSCVFDHLWRWLFLLFFFEFFFFSDLLFLRFLVVVFHNCVRFLLFLSRFVGFRLWFLIVLQFFFACVLGGGSAGRQ